MSTPLSIRLSDEVKEDSFTTSLQRPSIGTKLEQINFFNIQYIL